MIADELQELASLHALGMLRGEEAAAFERECAENPELAALVKSLRDTADGLAFALPPVAPPAALRGKVVAGKKDAPAAKVIPFPDKAQRQGRWLSVASIAVLLSTTGLAVWYASRAMRAETEASLAAKQTQKTLVNLDERINGLEAEKNRLETSLDGAHTAYNTTKDERDQARAMAAKLRADLTMLQSDKDKLLAEVKALQARGLYDQARIALMASTSKPATKATAVSLWDQDAQGGVIVVQNLPALPADRNYQLWVLDDGQPVSAGLLTLDGKGGGRIEFKARKAIAKPTLFAVTNETKGEKDAPDLKQLVLAGQ